MLVNADASQKVRRSRSKRTLKRMRSHRQHQTNPTPPDAGGQRAAAPPFPSCRAFPYQTNPSSSTTDNPTRIVRERRCGTNPNSARAASPPAYARAAVRAPFQTTRPPAPNEASFRRSICVDLRHLRMISPNDETKPSSSCTDNPGQIPCERQRQTNPNSSRVVSWHAAVASFQWSVLS